MLKRKFGKNGMQQRSGLKAIFFNAVLLATVLSASQSCILKPKAKLNTASPDSGEQRIAAEIGFNPFSRPCLKLHCAFDRETNPIEMSYRYFGAQLNPGTWQKPFDFTRRVRPSLAEDGESVGAKKGVMFRFWAPNAKQVFLYTRDTSAPLNWSKKLEMTRGKEETKGIKDVFAAFLPAEQGGAEFLNFKYLVVPKEGNAFFRTDPYSNFVIDRDDAAPLLADPALETQTDSLKLSKVTKPANFRTYNSVVTSNRFNWSEAGRDFSTKINEKPLRLYEVHPLNFRPLTWKDETSGWPKWDELANEMIKVAQEGNYNAISLMPIAFHTLVESYGYQIQSFFATNPLMGTPSEFKALVDKLHSKGIAVVVDLVHSHSGTEPKNPKEPGRPHSDFTDTFMSLTNIDGTNPFYLPGAAGHHPTWDTDLFNYESQDTRDFLLSNAMYYMLELGVDGFRVDGIASMLYLNFDRDGFDTSGIPGARQRLDANGNPSGPKSISGGAVNYLRAFTTLVKKVSKNVLEKEVITIAEESTDWPATARSAEESPEWLGFDFKWRMGGMNYIRKFIEQRPANSENSPWESWLNMILEPATWGGRYVNYVSSHDEVINNKWHYNGVGGSAKNNPSIDRKHQGLINLDFLGNLDFNIKLDFAFAQSRNLESLVHLVYPGLPMTWRFTERGATGWWNIWEAKDLSTINRDGPRHDQFAKFMKELGTLYMNERVFLNYEPESSKVLFTDESKNSGNFTDDDKNRMYAVARYGKKDSVDMIIIGNMSHHHYDRYLIPLPKGADASEWELVFNTDASEYGGRGTLTYFGNGPEYSSDKASGFNVADLVPMQGLTDDEYFSNWPDGEALKKPVFRLWGHSYPEKSAIKGVWVREFSPYTTLVLARKGR